MLLLQATLPDVGRKSIRRAIRKHFNKAAWITTPLMHRTIPSLSQRFITCNSREEKNRLLLDLLNSDEAAAGRKERILIFVRHSDSGLQLQSFLKLVGKQSACLHKELPTEEKDAILQRFTSNPFDEKKKTTNDKTQSKNWDIIITTDMASRGLDFVDVDHVIQYDFVNNAVNHLHRCVLSLSSLKHSSLIDVM